MDTINICAESNICENVKSLNCIYLKSPNRRHLAGI